MTEPINCPICDSGEWKPLDAHRSHDYWYAQDLRYTEPVGFKLCMSCGFTTYDYMPDLGSMYNEQRKAINMSNIVTGNRKGAYHKFFLADTVKPEMRCLDVGAAQGSFLNLLHTEYGVEKKNLSGAEYSEVCRNFSKNYYGIPLTRDAMPGKYDFISYYHVLEHIPHPDRELIKIREWLTDDGLLYISVPIWYGILEEAAGQGAHDFENLFHVNHINTWSLTGIRNLMKKTGFDIIKENVLDLYGYTFLCKKGQELPIEKENPATIEDILLRQKAAIELMNSKRWAEAEKVYPAFPDNYIVWSMSKDLLPDVDGQVEILKRGLNACNGSIRIKEHLASIMNQWDESGNGPALYSNNVKTAERLFMEVLEVKPSENSLFFLGMIEGRYKRDPAAARRLLEKVIEINPGRFSECMNFLCNFAGKSV